MLQVIELTGSPYEMGTQHGEQLKEQVRGLARERYEIACQFARDRGVEITREDCLKLARVHLQLHQEQTPRCYEEWSGIAAGADCPLEDVFFANALTDFQDVLWQVAGTEIHGCTSFAVTPAGSSSKTALIGQTWDMHASAQEYISLFHRRPPDGPESLTMSTAGCLTLVGINAAGIAVGNNNLQPMDARPGIIYLALLHGALQQTDWDQSRQAITGAYRASGHNYMMAHESGVCVDIETTAEQHEEYFVGDPWYAHTNHYLSEHLKGLENPQLDRRSTEHRLEQVRHALAATPELLSPEHLRSVLADHEGEALSICRHGEGREARSCAFVVADPAARSLWASLGPPCEGQLTEYSL